MGSLMAGWDSPVSDPKSSKTNRSLTKEEIAAFWRLKKNEDDERGFLDALYDFSKGDKEKLYNWDEKIHKKSNSLPQKEEKEEDEEEMEKLLSKHGWWTSSKWAFLNEPPIISSAPYNYVSQFHVANKHLPNNVIPT